jgi:hypothetical protein
MPARPQKAGPINTVVFTSYQGNPFRWTNSVISQEAIGLDEVWYHGYLTERTRIARKGAHCDSAHSINKSRSQGVRPMVQ